MTDYRINLKIRNARLLRAIESKGYQPGAKFAALVGISYSSHLLPYLNLTRAPFDADGNLRPCAEKLCVFFNAMPSELWTDEQCIPLAHNTGEVELTAESVYQLRMPDSRIDPSLAVEREQATAAVETLLATLPKREADILRLRFGIDGEVHTLRAIGKKLKINAERVRHLEQRALQRLRRSPGEVRTIVLSQLDVEG